MGISDLDEGFCRECGQFSIETELSPLSGSGVEEQRITEEFLLGTWKLSSSVWTLWICLFMLDSRICPSPGPLGIDSRVLWRTEIRSLKDVSASSSSSFDPELSLPSSRPSRFLQTGRAFKDRRHWRLKAFLVWGLLQWWWSWAVAWLSSGFGSSRLFNVATLVCCLLVCLSLGIPEPSLNC